MKFSLIIPTLGRKQELDALLFSISQQTYQKFEVIIVDQNNNDLIDEVCAKYEQMFLLIHKKVSFKGAARSRNYGVHFSSGDYINFPDDDSEFSEQLLELVMKEFTKANKPDILFCKSLDKETGEISGTKLVNEDTYVTEKNIYYTSIEYTMFLPKSVFIEVGGFDPNLGVGTFYGAEEGSDFVLRSLYKGKTILYKTNMHIFHPEKINTYDDKQKQRVYSYGLGVGRLAYKHIFQFKRPYAVKRYLEFVGKAFVGIFLYAITNKNKSSFYFFAFKGRLKGFFSAMLNKNLMQLDVDEQSYK